MLLADAYDDDCGLAAWNGNEEFLLKVLKEMHDPTDRTSNYEAQIEHLEEGSQGMTLEEFVVQLHEEVDTFRGNWIERNKHSGDQRYPMSFSVDEWYEQYLAWMGVQEG